YSFVVLYTLLLRHLLLLFVLCLCFFYAPATPEIYTLSLHDALPIWLPVYAFPVPWLRSFRSPLLCPHGGRWVRSSRSACPGGGNPRRFDLSAGSPASLAGPVAPKSFASPAAWLGALERRQCGAPPRRC